MSSSTLKARFIPALPSTAVRFDVAQTLSAAQKTQAQTNLGIDVDTLRSQLLLSSTTAITPYAYGGDPANTDNTDAFVAMLADPAAVDIYIPAGVWKFTANAYTLGLDSWVRRFGGPGTLQYTGSDPGAFFFTIGNNQYGLDVYGLTFDVPQGIVVSAFGVNDFSGPMNNARVHDLRVINAGSVGIVVALTDPDSGNIRIDHNYVTNWDRTAILVSGCDGDSFIEYNQTIGANGGTGAQIDVTATGRTEVSRNYVYKNGDLIGINVNNVAQGSIIHANVILEGTKDGISLNAQDNDVADVAITDNLIGNINVAATDIGIGVNAYSGKTISSIAVKGNTIFNRADAGVGVATIQGTAVVKGVEVAQNFIRDCNLVTTGTAALDAAIIFAEETLSASTIGNSTMPNIARNNTIISTTGASKYGVSENVVAGTVDYTICDDNYIVGVATAQYNLSGTHSAIGIPRVSNKPITKTSAYTVLDNDDNIILNGSGSITVTLPSAAAFPGREISLRTIAAQTVVSASSNVVPLVGGSAATAILAATAGKWARLKSDGTNWQIMAGN